MGDGFQRGTWGSGSHGDPGPELLLPTVTAEDLLNGHLLLVPEEYRPLADTVAALCGPPSEAELRGEARARAAFRALGSGELDDPAASSHTLPLEPRAPGSPRRSGRGVRARHRSPALSRPPGRRGIGGRLRLVSGAAAAVIAAAVGLAYAGGAFSAHVKNLSSAAPPSSARPTESATGSANVAGVGASQAPTSSRSATATATAGDPPADPSAALCQAWLQNPWHPGAKNWDDDDFGKLTTLAGGPQLVLFYCWKHLPRDYWGTDPAQHYPSRYSNGRWAWIPGDQPPAQGNGSSQGSGNAGPGGGSQNHP